MGLRVSCAQSGGSWGEATPLSCSHLLPSQDLNCQEEEDPMNKLKGQKIVSCRICKGDHWTTRCPYKDTLGPMQKELAEQLGLSTGEKEKLPGGVAGLGWLGVGWGACGRVLDCPGSVCAGAVPFVAVISHLTASEAVLDCACLLVGALCVPRHSQWWYLVCTPVCGSALNVVGMWLSLVCDSLSVILLTAMTWGGVYGTRVPVCSLSPAA